MKVGRRRSIDYPELAGSFFNSRPPPVGCHAGGVKPENHGRQYYRLLCRRIGFPMAATRTARR
jgi:hypothetical protein